MQGQMTKRDMINRTGNILKDSNDFLLQCSTVLTLQLWRLCFTPVTFSQHSYHSYKYICTCCVALQNLKRHIHTHMCCVVRNSTKAKMYAITNMKQHDNQQICTLEEL